MPELSVTSGGVTAGMNSRGYPTQLLCYGHHEGMVGGGGAEQPQRAENAAGALPVLAGEEPGADEGEPGHPGHPGDPSAGEVHLTSLPESASTARRLSLSVIERWGLDHLADTVELLVSELVGNAVRHTGARTFGLRMHHRRGWIRVEVRDPSRALPCLLPVREMDVSGRGLFLVDRLSDRWGVDLLARGKTTWFELRVVER
jgi:anti-sigma regulatory factor (Ser/Thr protein kinase)